MPNSEKKKTERQSIAHKGYVAMKSYFDPVLEKDTISKKAKYTNLLSSTTTIIRLVLFTFTQTLKK